MDFNIKLSNGQILKGMIQSPGENMKAVILLIHGLGEHVQRYNYWAELFNKEGIAFTGVDFPGHGRSDGRRGNIKNSKLLSEILDILLNSCRKTFPGVPIFLYGNSMGGCIVLDYIIRKNPRIKGAVVTSPWLRLSFEPSKTKLILVSVLRYILPGLTRPSGLVVDHISHDVTVVADYKSDPLVHGKISTGLFHAVVSAGKYSLIHAPELDLPTLLLHGSDDLITSPEASKEFASKAEKVDLKIWDGGYHELHNEPFKDEVFTYIMKWISKKLEG